MCVLYVMLEAAQGAGMTEKEAERIFNSITGRYNRMKSGFPRVLLGEMRKALNLQKIQGA